MSILFYSPWHDRHEWLKEIKKKFKNKHVVTLQDNPDLSKIKCAIIWDLPNAIYRKLNGVKLLFSAGAGVDHILNMPSYNNVPIIRLKDASIGERVSNHVLSQILHYQLDLQKYMNSQKKRQWLDDRQAPMNAHLSIGVLGVGFIGTIVGNNLFKMGYKIQGYKNSKPKKKFQFPIFFQKRDLSKFIKKSDIIVSILPDTLRTNNFINKDFFKLMKKKSLLINVGRGNAINEKDLINHLRKNKDFQVSLDVFKREPLPKNHPFWRLSNVTITPHIAGLTVIESAVDYMFKKYQAFEKNKNVKSDVDIKKGY